LPAKVKHIFGYSAALYFAFLSFVSALDKETFFEAACCGNAIVGNFVSKILFINIQQ